MSTEMILQDPRLREADPTRFDYLGDGAYVGALYGSAVIFTFNGLTVRDVVVLDSDALDCLARWRQRNMEDGSSD